MLTCVTCTCYVTSCVGWGWGVSTFRLTCVTCTCYVTSWVGWVGCVNVHVNLRHMHMLRHVLGWVGWGVLTFMLTCATCTCYVTSWVGWVGCVNVHVNLRHMHMLRHVWVPPCWHHNCRIRTDVDTDVELEQDLVTCRH